VPGHSFAVIALRLYTRPGCHLCDDMKAQIQRVARATNTPIALEEVDISTDANLETRYGLEIPVLVVNGKKAAKYRINEDALARILRAGGPGTAGGSGETG